MARCIGLDPGPLRSWPFLLKMPGRTQVWTKGTALVKLGANLLSAYQSHSWPIMLPDSVFWKDQSLFSRPRWEARRRPGSQETHFQ